jgi:hypothetical protein
MISIPRMSGRLKPMLLLAGTVLIIVLIAAFVAIDHAANRERARARVSMELGNHLASPVDRGAYVARAADCMACHTAPGQRPYAGGLVMNVGFGTLSSPNITPDAKTGIGGWTKEQFRLAVREGIRPDGSLLYPAMPFPPMPGCRMPMSMRSMPISCRSRQSPPLA